MRSRFLVLITTATIIVACGPTRDARAADSGHAGAAVTVGAAPAAMASPGAGARAQDTADVPGHRLGDPKAPIVVVEFSDFGCPYCARFARTTLPELRSSVIDDGTVRWRYVPVTFGFPGGRLMAAAAECAAEIGGEETFWSMHDFLYRNQTALRGDDARTRLLAQTDELGLDHARMEQCLQSPSTAGRLQANNLAAQEWLVRGTPTFVINGIPTSGALPTAFFQKMFSTLLDPSVL